MRADETLSSKYSYMTEGECMIRIMKENTEYLELFIIIVDDTKFQQDQENLIFFPKY